MLFYRSTDGFCTWAAASAAPASQTHYKVEILEAKLLVPKHTILPSIMLSHVKLLEGGKPICYPMRRVEMKSYTLPAGTIQNTNENLFNGFLPDRIILGLLESTELHGTVITNPFNFRDFGLAKIKVTANGEQVSTQSYDVSFDNNNARVMQPYIGLFTGLGYTGCDSGMDLSFTEFKSGKGLFVYDLRNLRDAFSAPRHGNISINLKFSAGTAAGITVVVYSEYQSVLFVNSNKEVYFKDYSKEA
jgi:hypothetical protein